MLSQEVNGNADTAMLILVWYFHDVWMCEVWKNIMLPP